MANKHFKQENPGRFIYSAGIFCPLFHELRYYPFEIFHIHHIFHKATKNIRSKKQAGNFSRLLLFDFICFHLLFSTHVYSVNLRNG